MEEICDKEIQAQIAAIKQLNMIGARKEMREQVDLLRERAQTLQHIEGMAAALLFDAFLSSYEGEFDASIEMLDRVATFSQEHGLHSYCMRAYNSLANAYAQKGDFYSGLSYYLSAYHIADEHPEYQYDYVVLNNIGNLFEWLDEYKTAALYLEQAYDKYFEMGIDDQPFLINLVINLVDVHSYLGEYEKAEAWSKNQSVADIEEGGVVVTCLSLMSRAVYTHQSGNPDEATGLMEEFLEHSVLTSDYIYIFRCLIHLLGIALEVGDVALIERLLARMETMQEQTALNSFDYRYAELKLEYYRRYLRQEQAPALGDTYTDIYFEESKKTIVQLKHTYVQSLLVQLELDRAKQETHKVNEINERLQRDMQKDVFTNLYNKVSSEQLVRARIECDEPDYIQMLAIIDIDLFKNINDIYGHHYGDIIILKTAQLLERVDLPDKIVGRFGGDEYMIFAGGFADVAAVKLMVKKLLVQVHKILLPDSRVRQLSFSMGIYLIDTPSTYEQAFLAADAALYRAKEMGRNRAVMTSATGEDVVIMEGKR